MRNIIGKSVNKGTVIGEILVVNKANKAFDITGNRDATTEKERVSNAVAECVFQLDRLYDKTVTEYGEKSAEIVSVHKMLIQDDEFLDMISDCIESNGMSAEAAVLETRDNLVSLFAAMDDEYMRERSADIKDVSDRLLNCLLGKDEAINLTHPSIVVANDLTPSETIAMDKNNILAFVTVMGTTNSHTAILARMMGIPAIVSAPINLDDLHDGMKAIVFGEEGTVVFEPTAEQLEEANARIANENCDRDLMEAYKGKSVMTPEGKHIGLYANIGSVSDLEYVLKNDAEGIGLFRSEFLFLGRAEAPSEAEQYEAYSQVLSQMNGKKVVIRTLDIGADKQVDYFGLEPEENPALGMRAIRICLTQTELFKVQLRALIRASVHGNLAIMYPMITSCEEVQKISAIVEEVKRELDQEGIEYSSFEQGIMIETPAAALISDELAEIVDFFSVGTNDLTQYTLALDRQSLSLDEFYNPRHRAVLKLIEMAADNIHRNGKWIGICGELGADISLAEDFVRMGIDELSMAPSKLLLVRKHYIELLK